MQIISIDLSTLDNPISENVKLQEFAFQPKTTTSKPGKIFEKARRLFREIRNISYNQRDYQISAAIIKRVALPNSGLNFL